MARIFNTIRQSLLAQGSVRRYLTYAVGEIVLVVIGILIAVNINDWNEQRKIKLSNSTQLQNMIVELEANIARMELLATNRTGRMTYGLPSQEEAVANCESLLRLTYAGLSDTDIPFLTTARFFAGQSSLNLQQDVFEELKSTGRLNTVGSDSLVAAIKSYNKRYLRDEYYAQLHNAAVLRDMEKIETASAK